MLTDELTFQIQARFNSIPSANETATRWLAERKAPSDVDYFANLAIEELVTNCVKYGYKDNAEHTIEIKMQILENELALTVTDDGTPFNPLELPAPDIHLPLEERPIGGLGIYMLKRMSDRMEYVRAEGKNRVTLRKSMHPGTAK